jgi:hypothetical protein
MARHVRFEPHDLTNSLAACGGEGLAGVAAPGRGGAVRESGGEVIWLGQTFSDGANA